jgi:hypothetical protein
LNIIGGLSFSRYVTKPGLLIVAPFGRFGCPHLPAAVADRRAVRLVAMRFYMMPDASNSAWGDPVGTT